VTLKQKCFAGKTKTVYWQNILFYFVLRMKVVKSHALTLVFTRAK